MPPAQRKSLKYLRRSFATNKRLDGFDFKRGVDASSFVQDVEPVTVSGVVRAQGFAVKEIVHGLGNCQGWLAFEDDLLSGDLVHVLGVVAPVLPVRGWLDQGLVLTTWKDNSYFNWIAVGGNPGGLEVNEVGGQLSHVLVGSEVWTAPAACRLGK